jgi:hypothetical protein
MPAVSLAVSFMLQLLLLLGDKAGVADGPDGEDGVVVEDEVKPVFAPIAITALSGVVAL